MYDSLYRRTERIAALEHAIQSPIPRAFQIDDGTLRFEVHPVMPHEVSDTVHIDDEHIAIRKIRFDDPVIVAAEACADQCVFRHRCVRGVEMLIHPVDFAGTWSAGGVTHHLSQPQRLNQIVFA